jgi:hypothetical protein
VVIEWFDYTDDEYRGRLRIDTGQGVVSVMYRRGDGAEPAVFIDKDILDHLPEDVRALYEHAFAETGADEVGRISPPFKPEASG